MPYPSEKTFYWLPREELIPAWAVKKYILSKTSETIMTIVSKLYVPSCIPSRLLISSFEELEDARAAERRLHRAEMIAYLKGCCVHAWTWMASHLHPGTSGGDLSQIQASPQNSQRSLWASILERCNWKQRKDSGEYAELKEDIKEK
jgi:hypothetical protein